MQPAAQNPPANPPAAGQQGAGREDRPAATAPPAGRADSRPRLSPPPHRRLLRRKVAAVWPRTRRVRPGATRRQLSGQGHRRRQGDRDEDCRDRSGFTTVGSFSASSSLGLEISVVATKLVAAAEISGLKAGTAGTISVPTTLPHPSPAFAISRSAPPIDFLYERSRLQLV